MRQRPCGVHQHKTIVLARGGKIPVGSKRFEQPLSVIEIFINNGIDLMPTVLDWADTETIPEWCKGRSMRYAVENPDEYSRNSYVVCETLFAQTGGTRGWALRTPRYKYVLYEAGANREMLFDMTTDRLEMTNLAVESKFRAEVLRHRELLRQWLETNPQPTPLLPCKNDPHPIICLHPPASNQL